MRLTDFGFDPRPIIKCFHTSWSSIDGQVICLQCHKVLQE